MQLGLFLQNTQPTKYLNLKENDNNFVHGYIPRLKSLLHKKKVPGLHSYSLF